MAEGTAQSQLVGYDFVTNKKAAGGFIDPYQQGRSFCRATSGAGLCTKAIELARL